MKYFALAAFALIVPLHGPLAHALPPMFVYGEDSNATAACQLTSSSAVDAIKSALRYNGVTIASEEDYLNSLALALRVGINALSSGQGCAVAVNISLYTYQRVYSPIEKKSVPATVEYCSEHYIFTGARDGFQSRVNNALRDAVDGCMTTYEEKLKQALK